MSERGSEGASTSRINSAMAYSNVNGDLSAMAIGGHGEHAPGSVELGRNCRRNETEDCEGSRESEVANTIGNHGRSHSGGSELHK
jgi:hypothetical protein